MNKLLASMMVLALAGACAPRGAREDRAESPAPAGEAPATLAPADIANYKRLSPALAVAGAPSPGALARLREMGFRTVVNLRTEKEGAGEEKAVVEAQGLRYVHVPVTPETFSAAEAAAVQEVLDDPGAAPVLFHCASSNRVGAVYAVIQAGKGKTLEQALAAGREAGLQSPAMEAAARRVIEAQAAPAPAVKP